ncbi:hypothetical protein NKH18_04865 [Streptomyces sp. M10(2022)]
MNAALGLLLLPRLGALAAAGRLLLAPGLRLLTVRVAAGRGTAVVPLGHDRGQSATTGVDAALGLSCFHESGFSRSSSLPLEEDEALSLSQPSDEVRA